MLEIRDTNYYGKPNNLYRTHLFQCSCFDWLTDWPEIELVNSMRFSRNVSKIAEIKQFDPLTKYKHNLIAATGHNK